MRRASAETGVRESGYEMKVATGYVVATVAIVAGLIYFLTRKPAKVAPGTGTGTGSSTTNAVLGFGTALANLGSKLLPRSSNTSSTAPGPGDYVGVDYGAGSLVPQTGSTPDNASGTGNDVFGIGTG